MEGRDRYTESVFTTLRRAWAGFMGFVELLSEEGMGRDISYLAQFACENAQYTVNEISRAVEENIGEIEITWLADRHGLFNPGKVGEVTITPAGSPQKIVEGKDLRSSNGFPGILALMLCGPKGLVGVLEGTNGRDSSIFKTGRLVCENVQRTVYTVVEIIKEHVGTIEFEWTDNEYIFHNPGEIKGVFFRPVIEKR